MLFGWFYFIIQLKMFLFVRDRLPPERNLDDLAALAAADVEVLAQWEDAVAEEWVGRHIWEMGKFLLKSLILKIIKHNAYKNNIELILDYILFLY